MPESTKKKYYVVWQGREPGIYDSWDDCLEMTTGFPGARFKSFPTREAAVRAFRADDSAADSNLFSNLAQRIRANPQEVNYDAFPEIQQNAIAVDGACARNPGPMEYRGVYVATGRELFRVGPLPGGTNNIGEFLALVHALALLKQWGRQDIPVYSDSLTARAWLRRRQCGSRLQENAENHRVFSLIARANRWLALNNPTNPILKWETTRWGEIPADFGRK